MSAASRRSSAIPLEGEDITTSHWEDARHWMSIYNDLISFKRGLLARVEHDVALLTPVAQRAASEDLRIISEQMDGYQQRLDLWYRRVWDLKGLWLDAEGRLLRYQDRERRLTRREFQILRFLIDNPHRFFTADQLKDRAWAEPSLFPEEVRNYVRRIRKILAALEIPCELVNRPSKGYSLVLRVNP